MRVDLGWQMPCIAGMQVVPGETGLTFHAEKDEITQAVQYVDNDGHPVMDFHAEVRDQTGALVAHARLAITDYADRTR